MAILIESSTVSSGYEVDDGTTGSAWYWDITKPTGLQVGELLFAITQNELGEGLGAPAGWTTVSGTTSVAVSYKFADSSDVAASTFRFTTADTANRDRAAYVLHRISGTHGSVIPQDIFNTSFVSDNSSSGSPFTENLDPNIFPPSGTLMFYIVSGRTFNHPDIISVAVTGPTGTVTTRKNNSSTEDAILFIAEQITTSAADITNIAVNYTGTTVAATSYVSAIALYPQQNASETVGFFTTGNTAFTPAGSAGASLDVGFATTANTAFDPTAKAINTAKWTSPTKPSSDWTNKDL